MKQYMILKLVGLVILTMAILIALSFLEVAIYSYLINPGQDQSVYEAHANVTAPHVSGIFGFIIFFLVVRYWKKKEYPDVARLAVLFPVTYLIVDIIILTAAGVKWSDFILIFALANAAKFLGSYLGYTMTK